MFENLPTATEPLLDLIFGRREKAPPQRSIREMLLSRSRAQESPGGGYGETALARELDKLRGASQGTRNHALNAAGFSLFQLVNAGELDEGLVWESLSSTAMQLGLGAAEITQTLRSAQEGAAARPRSADRLPSPPVAIHSPVKLSPGESEPIEFADLFLKTPAMRDQPPPVPLLGRILVRDSLAAVYGQPGSMKSFLAIDWAMHIARSRAWGMKHKHSVVHGRVIYIVAEGKGGIGDRIRAWEKHYGEADVEDIYWYPYAGEILNAEWVTQLCVEIGRIDPVLVIVDTLSRSMPGGDENDSVDMTKVIRNLDLMRQVNGATILLVHHTPKSGGTLRGHGSLMGAVDTAVECHVQAGGIKVRCEKQKDAQPFEDILLYWHAVDETRSIVLTEEAPPAADLARRTSARGYELWDQLKQQYSHLGATAATLIEATGIPNAQALAALDFMVGDGSIRQEGQRFYVGDKAPFRPNEEED